MNTKKIAYVSKHMQIEDYIIKFNSEYRISLIILINLHKLLKTDNFLLQFGFSIVAIRTALNYS